MSDMAIWEDGKSRPKEMDRDGFLLLLDALRSEVERDGSMEGSLTYSWGDDPGTYLVAAFLRTGNDMGQGGAMIVKGDPA